MADSSLSALTASTPGTAGLLYTVQAAADRKLSMTAAGAQMLEAANAAAQAALLTTLLPKTGGTMTGALINSLTGDVTTPSSLKITGAPFTDGSPTSTKPLVLIETAGATSNTWNTAGTLQGWNGPSGFAGDIWAARLDGGKIGRLGGNGRLHLDTVLAANAGAGLYIGYDGAEAIHVTANQGIAMSKNHVIGWVNSFNTADIVNVGFEFSSSTVIKLSAGAGYGTLDAAGYQVGGINGVSLTNGGNGILQQLNGANAQEVQVFGAYTDASNFERLALRTAAGDYTIAAEAAGTGTQRNLNLDGAEIHTVADLHPDGRLVLPMGEASYFDITGTSITISGTSDGSTNMVVISPTTNFNGHDFDNGGASNGRIRYLGTTTRMCHVAVTMSGTPATANDVFVVGVAKNGTVIAASKVLGSAQGTQFSSIHIMSTMAQNDYLELYIGNTTNGRDFTVKSLNLFAMAL